MIENIEFPSFLINSPEVKNECNSVNIWSLETLEGSTRTNRTSRAQCAETSRYYGLQGPFWRYFRLSAKQSSPMDSNTSFTCGLQTQYTWFRRIFPQNHVNIVSEARIDPLFVENGQKLTSVDQKVVMVMM